MKRKWYLLCGVRQIKMVFKISEFLKAVKMSTLVFWVVIEAVCSTESCKPTHTHITTQKTSIDKAGRYHSTQWNTSDKDSACLRSLKEVFKMDMRNTALSCYHRSRRCKLSQIKKFRRLRAIS
jgi:hypothetical protein